MTFWHRVVWAPHSFGAMVLYLFAQLGFAAVIFTRTTGKEKLSDDTALVISVPAAILIALIYWIPNALGQYWFLRAYKKMYSRGQSKDEERFTPIRK